MDPLSFTNSQRWNLICNCWSESWLSLPPSRPSFPWPCSWIEWAGFTAEPVILLPFVSAGLFFHWMLPPPPQPSLLLPSPALPPSFTLGPNYEIASNKYMYFFSCIVERGLGSLYSTFFFFDRRLKEVFMRWALPTDRSGRWDGRSSIGVIIVSH